MARFAVPTAEPQKECYGKQEVQHAFLSSCMILPVLWRHPDVGGKRAMLRVHDAILHEHGAGAADMLRIS
jgi:hypothetical protein